MNTPFGPLAAFLTSLPLDFTPAVQETVRLGFTHVDVVALVERPPEHLEALADAGVQVQCAALGRDLPAGCALDVADVSLRRAALDLVKRQIADAARLGATTAYLVPGFDATEPGLASFAEACALLADYAAQRMVRLCVEHIPGRALSTAAATLAWLDAIAHPNLYLLLDVGHCLITNEDVGATVRRAGQRLGYVHLDDNDGVGDLHWPLLTGRLTEADLNGLKAGFQEIGYRNGSALELNAALADPLQNLRASTAAVERLFV